jgi:hypothetical protein
MEVFAVLLVFVVVSLALGLIPARIAASKGHHFVTWWLFGSVLFLIALPCSLLVGPRTRVLQLEFGEKLVKCEHCAALISFNATQCHLCGRDVEREIDSWQS